MVKSIFVFLVLLVLPQEKPKVHSDFSFGTYPSSRSAEELLKNEKVRLILSAYAEGWSIDKLAKEFKMQSTELMKLSDELEEAGLAGSRGEYAEIRPEMVVVRERDLARLRESLQRHTQEFARVLQDNWKDIEDLVDSLEGMKGIPKDRLLYETAVSGILLGGMVDAFWEDKTLMLNAPRRGQTDRYYAWFVEGNPALAVPLKREIRESSGYRIVTIGNTLASEKLNADDLRGKATVLEEAEARRYRTFISLFSRDKLLPYFKARRDEFFKLGSQISSGRYVAFAEFFAWYYFNIANNVVDQLVAAKKIRAPEDLYTYAVKVSQ